MISSVAIGSSRSRKSCARLTRQLWLERTAARRNRLPSRGARRVLGVTVAQRGEPSIARSGVFVVETSLPESAKAPAIPAPLVSLCYPRQRETNATPSPASARQAAGDV